jgi:micrococcal nuclease
VRLLMLIAVVVFLLTGCSEASTPPEQPVKEDIENAEKQSGKEPTDEDVAGPAPTQQTSSRGQSPEEVLASQYQHINAGDYEAAYELFDNRSQQLVSLEQYRAYFVSVAPYEITSYSFASEQVQGDTASLVVDLAVSSSTGEDQYRVTQRLVRENGSWRVIMRDEQMASFTGTVSPLASASPSASPAATGSPDEGYDATVTISRVVDGDTIEISPAVDGKDEVRLIGVDTPETKDPDEGIEPYGPEATDFAADELMGQRIGLEFDVEKVDQYDRLLAYVYMGGEMFNEDLLEEGYAQAYPYPPNTRYATRFEEAQEEARAGGFGIWGLPLEQQCQLANHGNGIGEGSAGCEIVVEESVTATATATVTATATATAGPAVSGGVPPISEEECPPNAPIKGNASSGIYHMPNDAYYDATHPEECFATPQDAEAAGYRAAEV